MNKKIKVLIKNCKITDNRSLFIILGNDGPKQVPVFWKLLTKGKVKDCSFLWCSKECCDEFVSRNETLLNQKLLQLNDIDNSTDDIKFPKPVYCSYSDVEKILYQPFNLVVLQDFEALTPHTLALVAENVKGGGVLIFLLHNIQNMEDISSSKMFQDINTHQEISRFNKRFISSLSSLSHCLILDDNLNILSIASKSIELPEVTVRNSSKKEAIQELKVTHQGDAILSALLSQCQTADQAKLVITFMDILQKRAFHANISVSSPKGRGKSAALGLAIAGSLALNYSNIFISSLHYDNVKIIFRFLFKGLDALNYKEDEDYDLIESVNPQFNKALIGINVFRDHPQGVRFILPGDVEQKLEQAELIVIDEVAAIPLPLLKTLAGSHIVLMASTTSGNSTTYFFNLNLMTNALQGVPQDCFEALPSLHLF